MTDNALEDLPFVDQVSQPACARLLAKLRTRILAFLLPKLFDACTDLSEEVVIHRAG